MRRFLILGALLALGAACFAQPVAKQKIYFGRLGQPEISLYIADGDGRNERLLVPHRELEYSPSFSRDGRWIVFTAETNGLADIFRVHPDGSELQQLTNDPAFDDQGVLSPDGKTLAFVSSRGNGHANIWTLNLATRKYSDLTHHLSGNFRPSWSPDGKWIAFSSDRGAKLEFVPGRFEQLQSLGVYVIRADGTGLRRLTGSGGYAGNPVWSADGKKLLFYETDEIGAFLAQDATSRGSRTEISSIDVATGERTTFTASNETKLSPQWLAGGRFAYILRSKDAEEGLKIANPDGRVETVLKGTVRQAHWSADEKQLVYERLRPRQDTEKARVEPYESLAPRTSADERFTLVWGPPLASASPDGRSLVYHITEGETRRIGMMNTDGSGVHTLFRREGLDAMNPVWSPAGDLVAFGLGKYFRAPGFPPAQIAVVRPDGSGFKVVVDDQQNSGFPSWSPDGKRIVFRHGRQLSIVNLEDGKLTPLTDGSAEDNFPQWSPQGDAIMFTTDRDAGDFEIYSIRPVEAPHQHARQRRALGLVARRRVDFVHQRTRRLERRTSPLRCRSASIRRVVHHAQRWFRRPAVDGQQVGRRYAGLGQGTSRAGAGYRPEALILILKAISHP
jgi:TolB protein